MFAVSLVHFISQLIFHAFISTVFSTGIIILFWLVLISFHWMSFSLAGAHVCVVLSCLSLRWDRCSWLSCRYCLFWAAHFLLWWMLLILNLIYSHFLSWISVPGQRCLWESGWIYRNCTDSLSWKTQCVWYKSGWNV